MSFYFWGYSLFLLECIPKQLFKKEYREGELSMLFFACVEIIELPGSTILKLSKQFSLELCVEKSSSNLTYALMQVTKWKFFLLRTHF